MVKRSRPTTANESKETETARPPKGGRKFIRLDTAAMVTTAPQYICFGILRRALTIIEGIGAVGKSTLMYWICAILTLGAKFPDGLKNDPMNIAIISVEDIIDVVVEKLRIYQVDHSRIHLLPSMEDGSGKPWRFLIDQDAGVLRQYIIEHNIELFYIDAFVSHVGHGNDLW
jgi:hypothetical protein